MAVGGILPKPARETPLLIGESPRFVQLRDRLPFVARAQRTTLISGPTGSGKDVLARTLHDLSARTAEPFVTIHCAAIPETLVEAEMFGHSRGAFTGATQTRPGLIRSADRGTLFLDEIDSLPLAAQAKLLRFLETGEYRAVGSDKMEHSSAWVIAATNQDLGERVARGLFRADLMYRLAVVRLDVPPLSERSEDILRLADHFLEQFAGASKYFVESARRSLVAYGWPGNVRELRHRVEAAAIFSKDPAIDCVALNLEPEAVEAPNLPPAALEAPPPPDAARPAPQGGAESPSLERVLWALIDDEKLTLTQAVTYCERVLIQAALRAEDNNRTRAAGRLGIHVRTIFKKLMT